MFNIFPKRLTPICLAIVVVGFAGCKRSDVYIPESPIFSTKPFASPLTKKISDKVNLVKTVVADTLAELAPGVKQTTINYLDYSDKPMALYIIEADLKSPAITIKVGTPNNSTAFARQVVTDIARTQDAPNNRVIAAVNGDFFNGTTGEPQSILFKNGVAAKKMFNLCALCTYLSLDDQKTARIGAKDRPVDSTKIKEAIGGYHLLIRDSAKVSQGDASIDPRTAVGVTSNNVVYFVVVDGRQPNYSNGMLFAQLSNVFYALGVKDAINLDGGGSTTLAVKEGTGWSVKNRPSDGVPRAVGNAWTIVDVR